ncbi:hypothetical protein BGX33_011238 [Mortierella sp. NVP41]|nr:hypothetical protein BGX33_011238 [Mortierella sp. NVP41]
MRQNNCRHGAADGPTLKAIKHVWGNLMKATTTPSSSFDDVDVEERDFLGYTPLLAHQDEASAEEGLCESVSEKSTPAASGKTMNFGRLHRRAGRESALPRPRHILLASLWAWTLLMTLSAKMGFNSVEQIAMTPSFPSGILANVDGSISSGSAGSAPISILSSPLNNNNHINNNQPLEGKFDWSSTGAVLSLVEMDNDTDMDALWAEDQSTAEILEGSQPFARIQTSIVIVNNDDSDDDENDDEVDMEDLSTLDALTMDPQDEAVFHDFLHQLDQEDDKAIRAAAAEASFEQAQDQQQQQQRRRRLFKATDDLMAASMLENDLPCGRSLSSSSSFRNNKWLVRIQQFLVGDSMTAADDGGHYSGRTFIYLGWSTDLMIVAVAMCLGGVLVGLAQSKALCHQLLDQQYLKESTSLKTLTQRRRRASWTTLLACLCLSGSALALTFLMIADKSWDVPAIYFVGIGIAGIILVHAWVPNAALPVHHTRDNIDSSDNDDDDSEDDEDTCIGSDSEDADHNNKLASHVFGTTPLAWSQPMTERRNACSLDENRRREVVAAATFH